MPPIIRRIQRHLGDPDSRHRQIASGFLWVSMFVLAGKLAGAAKEMAIAWRYGVSTTVDAYVFVLNLISWPVSIWLSILSVVLIPLFARITSENPSDLPRFRSELLGLTLLIGLALCAFSWWGLPALLQSGWLGLSGPALLHALHMTPGLALVGPLGVVISFFSACLLASGRHRNTLFEAIPALVLLLVLLVLPATVPEPLIWGTLAGYALHTAALGVSLSRHGEMPAISLAQRSSAWPYFWTGIGIMSIGQALSSLTGLVDQFFAAGLGEGALSTLSYANRILALLLGLGATAISRATLPVFSDVMTQGGADIAKLALRWVLLMTGLGLAVLMASWFLAPWAVGVLFERGAFDAGNTQTVAGILRVSLFQVLFYFPSLVLVAVLAAQRRYAWIAASGAINLLSKLAFATWLVPILGIHGLVLSTVLMYGVSALTLAWCVLSAATKDH